VRLLPCFRVSCRDSSLKLSVFSTVSLSEETSGMFVHKNESLSQLGIDLVGTGKCGIMVARVTKFTDPCTTWGRLSIMSGQ
jgi:hypothetical protein